MPKGLLLAGNMREEKTYKNKPKTIKKVPIIITLIIIIININFKSK